MRTEIVSPVVSSRLMVFLVAIPGLLQQSCGPPESIGQPATPYVMVLGVAQDAGYPQAACEKACCRAAWDDPSLRRSTASLGIVDPSTGERWLIDATPDFKLQLRRLQRAFPSRPAPVDGILLTHAHMGHYTGLLHLGFEAIGAKAVPVHVMPRMHSYLTGSGPWDQLVRFRNIELRPLEHLQSIQLNDRIRITPFLVPHRDEYSETVGYHISGPRRSVLYIPDIDKWERWDTDVEEWLANSDRSYLDASFYADGEITGRDMSEIPHPFVVESMRRFSELDATGRAKIHFIHFNHTNPLLRADADAAAEVKKAGYHIAAEGDTFAL